MPAYVIADIDVIDSIRYEEYKGLAPLSIAKYGGRYIARGGDVQVLEGTWTPNRLVILEFPSLDRARQWWASAEYGPAKALRQATSTGDFVVIDGI